MHFLRVSLFAPHAEHIFVSVAVVSVASESLSFLLSTAVSSSDNEPSCSAAAAAAAVPSSAAVAMEVLLFESPARQRICRFCYQKQGKPFDEAPIKSAPAELLPRSLSNRQTASHENETEEYLFCYQKQGRPGRTHQLAFSSWAEPNKELYRLGDGVPFIAAGGRGPRMIFSCVALTDRRTDE